MSDVEGLDDQTYVAQDTGSLGLTNPVVNQDNLLVVARRSNIITPWLVVAMTFIGSGMEAASSSFFLHSIVIICFFFVGSTFFHYFSIIYLSITKGHTGYIVTTEFNLTIGGLCHRALL